GGSSAFTGSDSEANLGSLDTAMLEDMPTLPTMAEGLYSGEFVVTSDNDTASGATFGNNVLNRNFLVTDNIYSIDGIGVHDVAETSTLGTNSFTGAEDGFMMLTYYDISAETGALGLEILLGSDTEAGSALVVTLHDTENVYLDDVTLFLAESEIYDVTQGDVNNGTIQVMFTDPIILSPGAYFAGVEMFSNAGDNLIEIVDDITVPQPFYSSMIYVPDDAVYSNGNAAAIRLITADNIGISDAGELEGISIYPNPTENMIRIEMEINDKYTIEVLNVLGEVLYNSTVSTNTSVDMDKFGAGVYLVNVSTGSAIYSERVVVH
ncbi:MAG: T9SS type A sorting domain-containing protein, partial [Flavobacteriales bacterium]|nr:T9SS type A sorting domain-containing protein [Flavobacteriales bacterium]